MELYNCFKIILIKNSKHILQPQPSGGGTIWGCGCVLWHISLCRLFNAKSLEHKSVWFSHVLWHFNYCRLFNAKSHTHTHTHTHIYNGLINERFVSNIFKRLRCHFCIYFNGFKYCYPIPTIQRNMKHLVSLFYGISTFVEYLMPNPSI